MAFLWDAVEAVVTPIANLVGIGEIVSALIFNYFSSNYGKDASLFASFESETCVSFYFSKRMDEVEQPSRESQSKFKQVSAILVYR